MQYEKHKIFQFIYLHAEYNTPLIMISQKKKKTSLNRLSQPVVARAYRYWAYWKDRDSLNILFSGNNERALHISKAQSGPLLCCEPIQSGLGVPLDILVCHCIFPWVYPSSNLTPKSGDYF